MSAGNLAQSNYQQLQLLTNQVADCVRIKDFAQQGAVIVDIQTATVQCQNDLESTFKMSDSFSKSLVNVNSRINGIEASILGKMDKSELGHMEAMVSKIELFNEYKESTAAAIAKLQSFERSTEPIFRDHSHQFALVNSSLDQLKVELGKTALQKNLNSLANEVENHSLALRTLSPIEETTKVRCFRPI